MNSIWNVLDACSRSYCAHPFAIRETSKQIWRDCRVERARKKAKNTCYREQAGTISENIYTKRWSNSRITSVCKSRNASNVVQSVLVSRSNAAEMRAKLGK